MESTSCSSPSTWPMSCRSACVSSLNASSALLGGTPDAPYRLLPDIVPSRLLRASMPRQRFHSARPFAQQHDPAHVGIILFEAAQILAANEVNQRAKVHHELPHPWFH